MGEWKPIRLAALGDIVTGKTPSKDNPEDWGNQMPFVTPSDYSSYGKYATKSQRELSLSGIERLRKKVVPPGSILVTCIGSDMGKSVINGVPVITNQQINSISIRNKEIDSDFIYYSMVGMEDELKNLGSSGSAVPLLNKGDFEQIELLCPDLPEQRAIASVLCSLDAKIDLLHRQNKTLVAMAETLFRQWFVEEAEEGWESKAIEEIATRVACGPFGSSIKTDTFASEGVPIISGQHLWGVLMEDNTFNYITREHAEKLSKAKVRRGDVIFTHAGSIGQAALIPDTSRYEEYVLSQRQFFMRCDRTKVLPLYIAMYFHTREGKHALLANTSTSGVPSIARPVSFLRSMVIPVPPIEVQREFVRVVGSFYDKFEANKKETNTLTKLRDTLLPKLMSGEVRVEKQH